MSRHEWAIILVGLLTVFQVHALTKVACIGDSLTYGSGTVYNQDEQNKSYPAQLQLMLGPNYLVKNFGAPGHTAIKNGDQSYWNSDAFKEAREFKPDVVIIQLGSNDTRKQNETVRHNFRQDYYDLIYEFKEMGARVFVCLPSPMIKEGAFETSEVVLKEEIMPAIQEVAQSLQIPVIDNYKAINDSKYYWLTWKGVHFMDYVHLNEEGYKRMALTVYQTIAPELNIDQCSILVNKYLVLPGIWWGEARDTETQQHIVKDCDQVTPAPGAVCYAMQPYLTSPDGRARKAADEYWGSNDCTVAERRMHHVFSGVVGVVGKPVIAGEVR